MAGTFGIFSLFALQLLIAALLLSVAHGKRRDTSDEAKAKGAGGAKGAGSDQGRFSALLDKLRGMPVMPLGDGNFSKFVVERPRDYYAVLLFTATAAKYQCSVCSMTKRTFIDSASYYREQYDLNTTTPDKRVVFFVLEVDAARGIFGDMGLETVPRLYALPPTKSDSPKMKMADHEIEVRALMEGVSTFLGEIGTQTGVKISVTVNPLPLLVGLCLVAYLVSLLAAAAATEPTKAIFWYQSPKLWVVMSILCFGVGVSGSIFCVIRSAPLYGAGRGGVRIFAGQGRDQYLLEGIIVALMTVGCGLAGMVLLYGSKVRLPLGLGVPLRHFLVLAALAAFAVLCLEIGEAYVDKTRWYQVKETVDGKLWEFLTSGVKKSSGLVKRMIRLSELWLFEFKTWDSFGKKFKVLVADYVQRVVLGFLSTGSISNKGG